jgi:hypothetical protein
MLISRHNKQPYTPTRQEYKDKDQEYYKKFTYDPKQDPEQNEK